MSDASPDWALGYQTYEVNGREAVPVMFRIDAEAAAVQAEALTRQPMEVMPYRKHGRSGWAWSPR